MIDAITKKRLKVLAYGKGRPYIIVPEEQLEQLRAVLDAHKVRYEVDEEALSVDDEPYVAFVTLARDTDPTEVQRLLDSIPSTLEEPTPKAQAGLRRETLGTGSIRLRLLHELLQSARTLAERKGLSLNQLITLALAEKVSALMTEEYLGERARRGDRKKFLRAMSKVANVEPEERDKL